VLEKLTKFWLDHLFSQEQKQRKKLEEKQPQLV
jgi:hypothetical protein